MLLREYFQLAANGTPLKTRNGKGFKLIYVDPEASTDQTYKNPNNQSILKKYGMEFLPYNRYIKNMQGIPNAWGWVVWDGSEDKIYPLIQQFANEIGSQETPPDNGMQRTADEVLAAIEELKPYIMQAKAQIPNFNGDEIIKNAEQFKEMLSKGIGSKETMDALEELAKFRMEMSKHRTYPLSWLNTILIFLQKRDATDVRSKSLWKEMGYTPKPDATPIILTRPKVIKQMYGAKYDEIVRRFLEKMEVRSISELTPSQKWKLKRMTSYADLSGGYADYTAYDISDMVKGEGAEELPVNTFDWYDKDSDETEKEKILINACIDFGKSIGVKDYIFVDPKTMGGSRGSASIDGIIRIVDDKKNHGLLSTVVHETAHEIMHWEIVKRHDPNLEKYYRGGSALRGSEIVEQEAELCAWIVLSGFGYKYQQQHFNYMANWGMNVSNCNKVFDEILKVADFIFKGMVRNTPKMKNKKQMEDEF
jgi:hypothetical protein